LSKAIVSQFNTENEARRIRPLFGVSNTLLTSNKNLSGQRGRKVNEEKSEKNESGNRKSRKKKKKTKAENGHCERMALF